MSGAFGGSSGVTSAARIEAVIEEFLQLPTASQTSARFANLWSSRAVHYLDVRTDYIIGGGEANSGAGWFNYLRRLNLSTANTSTRGSLGTLGLPAVAWRSFLVDSTVLAAQTTHESGLSDAASGRRLYEYLVSTSIDGSIYRRGGQERELLAAWGSIGSPPFDSSGNAGYIIRDQFTDTNGVLLANHVPDEAPAGSAWAGYTPDTTNLTGTIQSNQVKTTDTGDGNGRGFVINSGNSSGIIGVLFTGNAINPSYSGIAFRHDSSGRWTFRARADNNTVELFDPTGNSTSRSFTFDPSQEVFLQVTLEGSSITCFARNNTVSTNVTFSTASTVNMSNTFHGIATRTVFGNGENDRFDDYFHSR